MKGNRHAKIMELIEQYNIETQEELADYLKQAGFTVTQATVSRDIRDLKLTKVPSEDGRWRYAMQPDTDSNLNEKYTRILKEGYVSMDRAQNLLVIKTVSGMAMAVCAALDAMGIKEIIGSIAGDDTIFCATKSQEDAADVMETISRMIL